MLSELTVEVALYIKDIYESKLVTHKTVVIIDDILDVLQ